MQLRILFAPVARTFEEGDPHWGILEKKYKNEGTEKWVRRTTRTKGKQLKIVITFTTQKTHIMPRLPGANVSLVNRTIFRIQRIGEHKHATRQVTLGRSNATRK
jgi:hypothetical protein